MKSHEELGHAGLNHQQAKTRIDTGGDSRYFERMIVIVMQAIPFVATNRVIKGDTIWWEPLIALGGILLSQGLFWLIFHKSSRIIDFYGRELANFNLSFGLYLLPIVLVLQLLPGGIGHDFAMLLFVLLTIPTMVLGLLYIMFSIAGIGSNFNGGYYHYPLTLKLIKIPPIDPNEQEIPLEDLRKKSMDRA